MTSPSAVVICKTSLSSERIKLGIAEENSTDTDDDW